MSEQARFKCLKSSDIAISWSKFQKQAPQVDTKYLGDLYLDAHVLFYNAIIRSLDQDIAMIMTEEMKKHPKSNITLVIPGFAEDEEFFQNSSLLLSLLEEKFNVSSVSTIRDLLADYHSMTYKPNEDPTPFIVKLQSSIKMINQLCGNTFQEDELRMGFQLLSKLANGPEEVSSLFNEVEKVTFSAVARSLCDWWDSLQRKADLDKNKAAKLSHHQSPITNSNFKGKESNFQPNFRTNEKRFTNNKRPFEANNKFNPQELKIKTAMIAILSPIDKLVKNENINHTALLTDYPRKPSELSAPKPIFVKDSGATVHCTNDFNSLIDKRKIKPHLLTTMGNSILIEWEGDVRLNNFIVLYDVIYVPESKYNIISESKMLQKGFAMITTHTDSYLIRNFNIDTMQDFIQRNLIMKFGPSENASMIWGGRI